jgi:hypothetical protein
MLNPKRLLVLLFLIQSAIFLLSACKQPLPKEDAEKHLRAFDNELISLMNSFQRTRSFLALKEIIAIDGVPLPFFAHKSAVPGGIRIFNFEQHKGVYDFDSISRQFYHSGVSDSIIIHYHTTQKPETPIRLIVSSYSEEATSSSMMFPTCLKACLYIGNKRTIDFAHYAKLEQQLPVEADMRIEIENYKVALDLSSRLRRAYANAKLECKISRDQDEIFHSSIKSKVGVTEEGGFYIRSLDMQMEVFPVYVKAVVDNDAINSNATDFIEEFNRHSTIEVFRSRDRRKLGDILLKTRELSDKLDYALIYEDDSSVFLEDLLLTVDNFLNIKK